MGGQYQLEENESPEDFDETCGVWGKLNMLPVPIEFIEQRLLSNINNPGVPVPIVIIKIIKC